jgi:peptidoglycan/LPS O-acetylase OafA/YrhL
MKEYFLEIFKINPKEINELYGIRAIGCYIVIAYHCFVNGLGFMNQEYKDLHPKFQNFEMLMDLFFVISSFLISYSFSNELKKHNFLKSWKNFFLKRSLRIFPPLYILLAFSIIIMGFTIQAAKQGANLGVMNSGIPELEAKLNHWWADVFYISNYFPLRMLIHGWSLSMEEQFYLAMPVFFLCYNFLIQSKKYKIITLLCLMLLPIAIRIYYFLTVPLDNNEIYLQKVFHPIHTHFDSFIAGILLMEIFKITEEKKNKSKFKFIFFIIFSVTFIFYLISFTFSFEQTRFYQVVLRISLYALLSFLIVLGTIQGYFSYLKRILANILLVFIGKLSYGIYLVHLYVSGFVMIKVYSYNDISSNDSISVLKSSFYTLLLSAFIALISYYFVEKPFLKIREWSQPKFNIHTQTFYFIPVSRTELKIVSWILTALSILPFYFFKQFMKNEFVPKSTVTVTILILLLAIPLLLNLYTLVSRRSLFFTFFFDKKTREV